MRTTLTMVVLIVANFMDLMDTTVVNVALPSIRSDLGMNPAQLEWVVAAYTLGLAATLVAGGRLGDAYGRRVVFVTGIAGFTAASAFSAAATSGPMLDGMRALQGLFAGVMVPQVLAAVQELYAPERRGPIYGLVGFVTGTASVVGPVLAGWLISIDAFGIGWRSIFAINVPVGIFLIVAALILVPGRRVGGRSPRLDLAGGALAAAASVAIVLPLIEGRQAGWPAWCWVVLGIGLGCVALLVVRERALERGAGEQRAVAPFIPPHLFRNRGYRAGTMANFTYQAGLVGFFLFLTIYLQEVLGFSALESGLTWLGFSLGSLAGSVVVSMPPVSRSPRIAMLVGGLLTAGGIVAASVVATATSAQVDAWSFAPALTVAGLGFGALIVPLYDATLASVPAVDAGAASGSLSMLQQFGGAMGVAGIGGVFYAIAGSQEVLVDNRAALHAAAWIAAALFACAAVIASTLRTGGLAPQPVAAGATTKDRDANA